MPGPARRLPSASDASPPDCAVTPQIAHSKYADRYARLVRIRVRTGSRFALRFATTYARTRAANMSRLSTLFPMVTAVSPGSMDKQRLLLLFKPKEISNG